MLSKEKDTLILKFIKKDFIIGNKSFLFPNFLELNSYKFLLTPYRADA